MRVVQKMNAKALHENEILELIYGYLRKRIYILIDIYVHTHLQ